MTPKITQGTNATEAQLKHIKRLVEDEAGTFTVDALQMLGLSRNGAQEIIEKSDLFKTDLNAAITQLLKKHSIVRRVPCVDRHSDGDWRFRLGLFGLDWDEDYCLLCFRDK